MILRSVALSRTQTVGEVCIVCHWGTMQTLKGTCDSPIKVHNLDRVDLDDFWNTPR